MEKFSLKKGIKTKFIALILLVYILTTSTVVYFMNKYLRTYSLNEYKKIVRVIGQNAVSAIKTPLFYSDYNQIRDRIETINLKDFNYILVYDILTNTVAYKTSGSISMKHIEDISNKINKNKTTEIKITQNKQTYYEYIFPVNEANVELGLILIGVSEKKLTQKFSAIPIIIFVINIIALLLFTALVFFLTSRITYPIKELSQSIQEFSKGNYKVRSNIKTGDEIQSLSDNFNTMADKINEQIDSIENYSKNLEKMVDERTEKLRKALVEVKEKEKKLTQMEKLRSLNTLVTSIAHHINNPLTVIHGNIQIIESDIKNKENREKIDRITKSINKISNLIDDISFFANLKEVTLSSFSVLEFIYNAISKAVPTDLKVKVDGPKNLKIFTEYNLLNIAIVNILHNSVQAITKRDIKKPKINIGFYKKDDDYVIFEITDNGGGIENPSRVFEPFYTTYEENKGLGMTFVYHIVQLLDGEVNIENTKNGAKVSLKVPVS